MSSQHRVVHFIYDPQSFFLFRALSSQPIVTYPAYDLESFFLPFSILVLFIMYFSSTVVILPTWSCSILVIANPYSELIKSCVGTKFLVLLVLWYSSLCFNHCLWSHSHFLHSWSLPKRGIFVDPPFCPLSTCLIKCLFSTL